MIGYNKSEIVGKMRERVILQNRIITQSDSGFQSEIYNDIGIYWSKIEYKTGFEEEDADKITNQQKINITLRYNILVNVNSRFVYRNELYQVEKVEYSDDRRFMTCVCVWRSSYTSIYAGSIFCFASLLAQSSLSAALMRVIKYQASLNAFGSVSADIALVKNVASSLNAFGTLTGDINFVQKLQASLLTSSSVTGNIIIPKLVQASLTGTGTTAANLTVGSAFDADAQAFFDRVTTAGGTLTTTEQNAVNTLVIQLKANGIWTKMKAIYPMVGASAAACAQNLRSSSFTGTFSSGWTFANTGVKPNGTSSFMDTGLSGSTQITNNNYALCHYSRTQKNTGAEVDIACAGSPPVLIALDQFYAGAGKAFVAGDYNTRVITVIGATNTLGFQVCTRTNQTTAKIFFNNLQVGSTLTLNNTNPLPLFNFLIGSGQSGVNLPQEYSSKECAFASIGDGLTDTEAANLYTAVQAFQTSLNRKVN